jgi:medium-chain acyl-[acyl-carrier-protein] hydrolase
LRCPVSAYAGADDLLLRRAGIDGWRAYTAGAFDAEVIPGGHFALIGRPDLVFGRLRAGSDSLLVPYSRRSSRTGG